MANRAVPLHVAADAGADVALRLPGVVARCSRTVGPLRLRWVEPPPLRVVRERSGGGHPSALMAAQAERLLAVAAGAFLLILAGRDWVHVEPIVRVNAARADSAVVAVGAVLFAVAVGAKAAVIARDLLVAKDPIWTVPGVV